MTYLQEAKSKFYNLSKLFKIIRPTPLNLSSISIYESRIYFLVCSVVIAYITLIILGVNELLFSVITLVSQIFINCVIVDYFRQKLILDNSKKSKMVKSILNLIIFTTVTILALIHFISVIIDYL